MAALNEMCQGTAITTYANKTIQDYTVGGVNPMTDPAWTAVLDQNNLGATKPGVPVYQYHGLVDEVIPYSVEQALHTQWCALGATSDLVGYPGEHVLTQLEAQSNVDSWIQGRIEGQAAPSDC
jgi:predicted esterase